MELLQVASGALLLALLILSVFQRMLLPAVLRWRGVVIEGHVCDRGIRAMRYGTVYSLSYSYHYQGRTYTHSQRVDEDTYHIWSEGGKAELRCLPIWAFIARLEV